MTLNHPQQLILAAVTSVLLTVGALEWKGYLRHSSEADSVYLAEFNLIKITAGSEQALHSKPSDHRARCVDGFLVMENQRHTKVAGVLVDKKQRVVRCLSEAAK